MGPWYRVSFGSRLCENSARYNRTQNCEAYGHVQSKKNAKIRPSLGITTKSDFVFAQPRSIAAAEVHGRRRQVLLSKRTPSTGATGVLPRLDDVPAGRAFIPSI